MERNTSEDEMMLIKAWVSRVSSLARVREYTITIVYYDGTRSVYNVRAYSAEDADYQAPRNVVGKKVTCRVVEPKSKE